MAIAAPAPASRAVSARRASPPATRSRCAIASSETSTAPARPRSSAIARRITASTPPSSSEASVSSSERESSGDTIEKYGFSVVAATSVTQRFSTAGSNASCWVLENRCTSSMNSTVSRPVMPLCRLACSTTARTSLTPALTAESSVNDRPVAEDTR